MWEGQGCDGVALSFNNPAIQLSGLSYAHCVQLPFPEVTEACISQQFACLEYKSHLTFASSPWGHCYNEMRMDSMIPQCSSHPFWLFTCQKGKAPLLPVITQVVEAGLTPVVWSEQQVCCPAVLAMMKCRTAWRVPLGNHNDTFQIPCYPIFHLTTLSFTILAPLFPLPNPLPHKKPTPSLFHYWFQFSYIHSKYSWPRFWHR